MSEVCGEIIPACLLHTRVRTHTRTENIDWKQQLELISAALWLHTF